jgi:glycosyltransferase involved in cell wall biosynthesis
MPPSCVLEASAELCAMEKMTTKIVLINKFYYLRGGTERYCLDVSRLLRQNGHTVIPFSMAHERNLDSEYARYFVDEISLERATGRRRPLANLRAAGRAIYSPQARHRLAQLIDDERPDLAYLHNIHHQISLSILPLLKEKGIPIVWRLHDYSLFCPNSLFYSQGSVCELCGGGRYHHIVRRRCRRGSRAASLVACLGSYLDRWLRLAGHVDLFIAPSRFLRDKMVQHGLDAQRLVVQPNFIPPDLVDPAPSPASPGEEAADGEGYLLYFGRLSAEKGVGTLIQAVARLPDRDLVIAGDGPRRRDLEGLASRLAGRRIRFTGHQAPEALRATLRRAGLVIVPSEWYENCPYTILEAFAAGKPVVASRIGGIAELVQHGQDGLLFEAGNAGEMADCIGALADDGGLRRRLGRSAREKVEALYRPRTHYAGLMKILGGLV